MYQDNDNICARGWQRVKGWTCKAYRTIREHGAGYYLRPPHYAKFLATVLLCSLLCFTLIRLVLLWRNMELLHTGAAANTEEVLYAFFMGLRFDIALCYYLLLPGMLLLAIGAYLGRHARWMGYATITLLSLGFALSLMCAIGDIPFYEYTGTHVNAIGIRYVMDDTSQAFDVVFGNAEYVMFFIAAIAASILFTLAIVYFARRHHIGVASKRRGHAAIYLVLLIALTPLTSRGVSFQSAPMNLRDSIISNNNFVNQLCVNPVIPFIESLLMLNDKDIEIMDSTFAREYVIAEYGRDASFTEHVEGHDSPWRNVIFILQEGNGAARLARNGDSNKLLPYLDSLIEEGLYFENAYSASTYTCPCLYSLITSMPPYMHIHPMEDGYRQNLHTIFDQVEASDRMSTMFLITHNPDFDNVGGFVTLQGFGKFISQPDYGYDPNKVWGVDDHVMFDRALKEIDQEYAQGNAFACVCLTCSNHIPFNAPTVEGFTPSHPDNKEFRAIEYADWAMHRFIESAKERAWFDETLFVITADHGRGIEHGYAIPESCVHIPLLFYSPGHIKPEVRSDLVAQMDIVPTAMSMLGIEYDNHSFGIDLNSEQRRMIPSTIPYHIIARDHNWLYISDRTSHIDFLYDLNAEDAKRYDNVINEHPDIAHEMDKYTRAVIQAGWDIHNTPMTTTDK